MLNIELDIPNTNPGGANQPFGTTKDDLTPGDETGTPLIKKWLNDLYYANYAVLFKAGVTPNGLEENTSASDFVTALTKLMEEFQSADFFNPTPQDIPNNTIKLSRAVIQDPQDPTADPLLIAAGAADGDPIPGVTADSRIDRGVFTKTGFLLKLGVQAAFPVPPVLLETEAPIFRTLVTTVGAPVFDNSQDLIINERVINRLPRLDIPNTAGRIILSGRVLANGTTDTNENFGSGAGFSVVPVSTGIYDLTFTGMGGFSKVMISLQVRRTTGLQDARTLGVADKSVDTGWGNTVGCRVRTTEEEIEGFVGFDTFYQPRPFDMDFQFNVMGLV